jgi:hypothetical protein
VNTPGRKVEVPRATPLYRVFSTLTLRCRMRPFGG